MVDWRIEQKGTICSEESSVLGEGDSLDGKGPAKLEQSVKGSRPRKERSIQEGSYIFNIKV